MYVTTEKNGIINPESYPRIDIYPDEDTYALCAFTERAPDQSEPKKRITIAEFEKRVDADYALIHLYRSLDMGKKTWDSKNVPLLSDIWNEVTKKFSNDKHTSDFIKSVFLNITLPDKLTITIPYPGSDEEIDDKEKDSLTFETNKISEELIKLLKEDPIFPIRTFLFHLTTDSKTT